MRNLVPSENKPLSSKDSNMSAAGGSAADQMPISSQVQDKRTQIRDERGIKDILTIESSTAQKDQLVDADNGGPRQLPLPNSEDRIRKVSNAY